MTLKLKVAPNLAKPVRDFDRHPIRKLAGCRLFWLRFYGAARRSGPSRFPERNLAANCFSEVASQGFRYSFFDVLVFRNGNSPFEIWPELRRLHLSGLGEGMCSGCTRKEATIIPEIFIASDT